MRVNTLPRPVAVHAVARRGMSTISDESTSSIDLLVSVAVVEDVEPENHAYTERERETLVRRIFLTGGRRCARRGGR